MQSDKIAVHVVCRQIRLRCTLCAGRQDGGARDVQSDKIAVHVTCSQTRWFPTVLPSVTVDRELFWIYCYCCLL